MYKRQGLSQCVGGLFPLLYFLRPNTSKLRLVRTKLELQPILNACGNGSSELMSNISSSIVSMVYNFQLLKYLGEDGVSAYGVLMYVQFVFVAIYIGYSIGCAPIVGFHYGAQNHPELKNMLRMSVILMSASGVVLTVLARVLACLLYTSTSSGSPMRRSGIGAEIRATSSSGSAATMSVRVTPVTIAVFPCSSSISVPPETRIFMPLGYHILMKKHQSGYLNADIYEIRYIKNSIRQKAPLPGELSAAG